MQKFLTWQDCAMPIERDNHFKTKNKIHKKILALVFLLFAISVIGQNRSNDEEIRTAVDLSYQINNSFKVNFNPEIRFNDTFSANKYLLETSLNYTPIKFIAIEGSYRYIADLETSEGTAYFNRYAFSVKAEKDFGRFIPAVRIKYTNDTDDEITEDTYMRYQFSLKYIIPNARLIPEIGIESFQQLAEGGGRYKLRYTAGCNYKVFHNQFIGAAYKYDYHSMDYLNKHIFNLEYQFKF